MPTMYIYGILRYLDAASVFVIDGQVSWLEKIIDKFMGRNQSKIKLIGPL